MTRQLRISTDRTGQPRWWQVTIHPTVEALHTALRQRGIDPTNTFAHTQPASYRTTPAGCLYPADGFAGDIRYAHHWMTPQIVAHELVHAALATYRMTDTRNADLGNRYSQAEETLAHIHSDLAADLARQLKEAAA